MDTSYASGLLVSRWGRDLFREAGPMQYFTRFMGKGPNNILQVKTELKNKEGDDVTFGLIMRLSGSAVIDDATLEGQEQSLTTYSQNVTLKMVSAAVRSKGRLHDRSHLYNFRSDSKGALAVWLAEYKDEDIFDTLSASPTRALGEDAAGAYRFDGTYKSVLADGDKVTMKGINILNKIAIEPYYSTEVRMRPVKIDGRNHFVLILSNEAIYDMKQDSTWNQANREARERGKGNPIFDGADFIYDNVIIHSHEFITTFTDGGSASVRGSLNLFLGAQAGVYAAADEVMWDEKRFNYNRKLGIAVGEIYGFAKTTFNTEDFATIIYCTANTQLTE